jgi:AbrB family looped-hinge helix DNA binding protein
MGSVIHEKISTKGQLTLPKEFRDKLQLKSGDEISLIMTPEGILITPHRQNLGSLRGLLHDEIDFEKANEIIKEERAKWRI